ncbi:MAG: alpha/beta fold hydrolase [Ignavibacteriae bacterium]|nr:MAG: alpha/beta fold hydrolase [Ignavibacteriota bacterium]
MISEKLYFKNHRGLKLAACLDLPDNKSPITYAIFSHCFTCSKELKSIANINLSLTEAGIAVLRFDYTGIGESEGNFTDSNYSIYIEDLFSASEFLEKEFGKPELLIGHSLGGNISLEAAGRIKSSKAIAVIGTAAEPGLISVKLKKTKARAIAEGSAVTNIGGVDLTFKPQFFEDVEKHLLKPYIESLNKPLLILHSPADTYSSIENAAIIFQTAKHPKSFISLDDMDHLLLKKKDALYTGKLIAAWSERYIR